MRELYQHDSDPFAGDFAATAESEDRALSEEEIEDLKSDTPEKGNKHLKPGSTVYTPALSVTMSNFFTRDYNDINLGDYRLTWWEDNSIVPKHPYLLINPVAFAQGSGVAHDMKPSMNIDPKDEHFVFVDSGGFQIKSFDDAMMVRNKDLHSFKNRRIHPEKLIEWQITNGTAGAVLDIPPFGADTTETKIETTDKTSWEAWYQQDFKPCLEESKEIAEMMYHKQLEMGATDFKLYGVLHGIPKIDKEDPARAWREWYEGLQEAGEFSGMCFGVSNMMIGKTALMLSFAGENVEEKNLHLLGTSSLITRILMDYFVMCYPDKAVTGDSTGFTVGGKYRQMLNPIKPGTEMIVSQHDTNILPIQTNFWPCKCVVCHRASERKGETWLLEGDNTEQATTMNMHNLQMLLVRHRTISAFMQAYGKERVLEWYDPKEDEYDGQLWSVIRSLFSKNVADQLYFGMKFIKLSSEKGISGAMNVYDVGNRFQRLEGGKLIAPKRSNSYMSW